MRRLLILAALAALALPATAAAKGASAAKIDGPGLESAGLVLRGDGESGTSVLGRIAQQAGFFAAVFGQQPDPMLGHRPKDNLGPRYTVVWTMPGPNSKTSLISQDVYPYAKPNPVSYVRPGQAFWDGQKTKGGWFVAMPSLRQELVSVGLPAKAPTVGGSALSAGAWAAIISGPLALVAAVSAFLFRRRRATGS